MEPENIKQFTGLMGLDHRHNEGRRKQDGFCGAHAEYEKGHIEYRKISEERDRRQNLNMKKLDQRLSTVEKDIKEFREDMPTIISSSFLEFTKVKTFVIIGKVWKWLWKAIIAGIAIGIGAVVVKIMLNLPFIQQLITNITEVSNGLL